MKPKVFVLLAISGVLLNPLTSLAATAAAAPKTPPPPVGTEAKIFSPHGDLVSTFRPFEKSGNEAGSLAVADLGSDKTSELIMGAGPGNKPLVRTFRLDGSLITEFSAYADGMKSGVNVAVCDLKGDGVKEIVTGAMVGGGPQIRVFSTEGKYLNTQFFAYDEKFRGGVNVACADIDGDNRAEIITGAGPGGGDEIKVFHANGTQRDAFVLNGAPAGSGVYVFTANLDADTDSEVVSAPMANGAFDLTIIDNTPTGFSHTVKPLGLTELSYGLSVAADGRSLIHANGAFAKKQVVTNLLSGEVFTPFPDQPDISPRLAVIPETGNIVVLGAKNAIPFDPTSQFIKVDISEQRLYAYVNGVVAKTFLVSTGKRGYNTPIGKTVVMKKIPVMSYVWNYGPGNPNNYNLPNVKWNMRVFPHIYIHSAYWHNNFGRPMSHGCINMSIPDAAWVYNFTSEGTSVETVP